MAVIDARTLNRATLERQLLLRRVDLPVVDAVSRLCALQAQAFPSPYLALWTRLRGFTADLLDTAFDVGSVFKLTLMRGTLHVVTARDLLKVWAAYARVLHSDAAGGPADAEFVATVRVPDDVPWRFTARSTQQAIALAAAPPHSREESQRQLTRSYLAAFGPARVHDVARFLGFTVGTAKRVVAGMELLRDEDERGRELLDLHGRTLPDAGTPAPARFLPMWDSMLLAYHDRARVISDDDRRQVIRVNGDLLPTVLVDGTVAGVWIPQPDGAIEVRAFRELPDPAWAELAAEAGALRTFLATREPTVYTRYRHWFTRLPRLETRVLG